MNTEIPPGFPVTVCPPGYAKNIPPQYVGSTGRKGMSSSAGREPAIYEDHARRLACAKISQMLMDLGTKMKSNDAQNAKTKALQWIGSEDFKAWCLTADIHIDDVLRRAHSIIEKGLHHRAERGKGHRYQERKKYRDRRKEMRAQAEALFNLSTPKK